MNDFMCLLIFLGLFATSVALATALARSRKSLVSEFGLNLERPADIEKWRSLGQGSFRVISDWRRLLLVRGRVSEFPENVQVLYSKYRTLSWIQNLAIVAMIVFAFFAGDICS